MVAKFVEVEIDSQVINVASELKKGKHSFALAVVTKTWGSSPRQAGSFMIIEKDGHMTGSVSGGCVEGEVVVAAKDTIHIGSSQLLNFGVNIENAWAAGLSCGGNITVFVCPDQFIQNDIFSKIKTAEKVGRSTTIICDLKNGSIAEFSDISQVYDSKCKGQGEIRITLNPKPRVFIIGAVQITQHLTPMAIEAGFEVIIIDPRSHFASQKRFPNSSLFVEWPDEALLKHNLSDNDSLVTLTHDPKIDDAAIEYALRKPLSCISCLGSERTNSKRSARLLEKGFSPDDLRCINSPAGIDIGSKTPAEIAVSILAQLIKSRRVLAD